MINVGISITISDRWIAGINYLMNLVSGIMSVDNRTIEPILLNKIDKNIEFHQLFKFNLKIINSYLKKNNILVRILNKISRDIYNKDLFCDHAFNKSLLDNNIQVLAYSGVPQIKRDYKIINWIPDFQHIRMPQMFSKYEIGIRNLKYMRLIQNSDAIILSSNDALRDFSIFAPTFIHKANVMQFVAQIDNDVYSVDDIGQIEKKYNFTGKYFYLPNQFWKHKNHMTVFNAINILKRKGANLLLLCSGYLNDYRHKNYVNDIIKFINNNSLNDNIKLLGLIEQKDVFTLMRNSISMLNPSFFEGWSTSIEEAKSLGKNIVVSDIEVHREQNHTDCVYFNPNDADALSEILLRKWSLSNGGPDYENEKRAKQNILKRSQEFGTRFQDIVRKLTT